MALGYKEQKCKECKRLAVLEVIEREGDRIQSLKFASNVMCAKRNTGLPKNKYKKVTPINSQHYWTTKKPLNRVAHDI